MGELEVMTTCHNCDTDFDDSADTTTCNCCHKEFCENCQEDHATELAFGDSSEEINKLIKHVEKRMTDEFKEKEKRRKKREKK